MSGFLTRHSNSSTTEFPSCSARRRRPRETHWRSLWGSANEHHYREHHLTTAVCEAFVEQAIREGDTFVLYGDAEPSRRRPIAVYHPERPTAPSCEEDHSRVYLASYPAAHLNAIETTFGYRKAVVAADLLDQLTAELQALRRALIQYDEMEWLSGECELIHDLPG